MAKTRSNRSRSTTRRSKTGSTRRHNGRSSTSVARDDTMATAPKRRGRVRRAASNVGSLLREVDLEKALVLLHTALAIAIVIKQTRGKNRQSKTDHFRSALSVLNHYLTEGYELTEMQRATLEDIKAELQMLYASRPSAGGA
jgi:Protein of unknown function (DUF3175)